MSALYKLMKAVIEEACFTEEGISPFLNENMMPVSFQKDEDIVTIFDKALSTYLVYDGEYSEISYSVKGEKNLLAVRHAPQLIGIVPLVEGHTHYKTDMVALTDLRAVKINNQYFLQELKNHGELGILVIKNLTRKVIIASKKIQRRTFFTTKDNFKFYLYEQWKKYGKEDEDFWLAKQNIMIADELGVSERTVYRTLNELKGEGVLSIIEGNIYIKVQQLEKLKAFYEAALDNSL